MLRGVGIPEGTTNMVVQLEVVDPVSLAPLVPLLLVVESVLAPVAPVYLLVLLARPRWQLLLLAAFAQCFSVGMQSINGMEHSQQLHFMAPFFVCWCAGDGCEHRGC